jgi:hypothetical protein
VWLSFDVTTLARPRYVARLASERTSTGRSKQAMAVWLVWVAVGLDIASRTNGRLERRAVHICRDIDRAGDRSFDAGGATWIVSMPQSRIDEEAFTTRARCVPEAHRRAPPRSSSAIAGARSCSARSAVVCCVHTVGRSLPTRLEVHGCGQARFVRAASGAAVR